MEDTNFTICENGCLDWKGPFDNNGAPVRMSGRSIFSPVTEAFINASGLIDPGMVVIQKCGNKKCVNPLHLSAGSYAQYESIVKSPTLKSVPPTIEETIAAPIIEDKPEIPTQLIEQPIIIDKVETEEVTTEPLIPLDIQSDDIKSAIEFLNNDAPITIPENIPEAETTKPFQEDKAPTSESTTYKPGFGKKRAVYAEDEYFDCATDAGIVLGVGAQTITTRIKKGLPGYRYA